MNKFWSAIVNFTTLAVVAIFIMIQQDADGGMLTDHYMGLHIALLVCIGLMVLNIFRAMQVCIYGEDF